MRTLKLLSIFAIAAFVISSCGRRNTSQVHETAYSGYKYEDGNYKHVKVAPVVEETTAEVVVPEEDVTASTVPVKTSTEVKEKLVEVKKRSSEIKEQIKEAKSQVTKAEKKAFKAKLKKAKKDPNSVEAKELREKLAGKSGMEVSPLIAAIIAIFIPFLGVALFEGGITTNFWIDLILTLLFYFPGLIYALIVILA